MWDVAQCLQDGINNLLNAREQADFLAILSDFHVRRCVRDLVFSLEVLLDTPAKCQLLPLLRHVVPKADRREFDRHTTTVFDSMTRKTSDISYSGDNRGNVYPKGVLKTSEGSIRSRPLSRTRTPSPNSFVNLSQTMLPNWETGIVNQVSTFMG